MHAKQNTKLKFILLLNLISQLVSSMFPKLRILFMYGTYLRNTSNKGTHLDRRKIIKEENSRKGLKLTYLPTPKMFSNRELQGTNTSNLVLFYNN